MVALQRGASSSAANPLLDTYIAAAGVLADPVSLGYQILDAHDPAVAPTQVFPASPGAFQPVNLTTDRVTAGLARFAATWTVPGGEPFGRHVLRWQALLSWTLPNGTTKTSSPTWDRDFEVLAVVKASTPSYALVADMRAESIPAAIPDWRIQDAISDASAMIDRWLCRGFAPVYKELHIDHPRGPLILLREPIIAIASVGFEDSGENLDPQTYRVYNRHLTEGLLDPDDRQAPSIEFIDGEYFVSLGDLELPGALVASPRRGGWRSRRPQNAVITGLFGFTDPDGSPVGCTPRNIRRACVMIAYRDLLPLQQANARFMLRQGYRATSLRTREQSVNYGGYGVGGADMLAPYTGDPMIDQLLLPYAVPLHVSVP